MKNIKKSIFEVRLKNLNEIMEQEIRSYDSIKNNHEIISFNDKDFENITKKIIKKLINDGDQGVNAVSPNQLKSLIHEIKIKLHELFMEFGTDSKFKYNPSSSPNEDAESATTPISSIQEPVLNPESSSAQASASSSAKTSTQDLASGSSPAPTPAPTKDSSPAPDPASAPAKESSSAKTSTQDLASGSSPAPTPAPTKESSPAPAPTKELSSDPAPDSTSDPASGSSTGSSLDSSLASASTQASAQNSSESQMSEIKYLDNSGDIFGLIQAEKGKFIKEEFIGDFNSTLCKAKFFIAGIGNFEINFSLVRLLKELDDKEITKVKSDQKKIELKDFKKSCKDIIETWKAISNWFSEDKIFFEEDYDSNIKSMPAWKEKKPPNFQDLLKEKKFSIEKKVNLKEFIIKIKNHDIAIKKYLDELKQAMEEEIKQDGGKKIFPIWKRDYFHPPKIFYKNSFQSSQNLEGDVSSKEVKIDDLLKLIERKITKRKEEIKSEKIEASGENEITVKIQKKAYYNLKSRPKPIIDLDHNEKLKKSVEASNSLSSLISQPQTSSASSIATKISSQTSTQISTSIT